MVVEHGILLSGAGMSHSDNRLTAGHVALLLFEGSGMKRCLMSPHYRDVTDMPLSCADYRACFHP